jgi:hypothetical protein
MPDRVDASFMPTVGDVNTTLYLSPLPPAVPSSSPGRAPTPAVDSGVPVDSIALARDATVGAAVGDTPAAAGTSAVNDLTVVAPTVAALPRPPGGAVSTRMSERRPNATDESRAGLILDAGCGATPSGDATGDANGDAADATDADSGDMSASASIFTSGA